MESASNQSWIETAVKWMEGSQEKRNELVNKVSAIVSEELEFVTGGSSNVISKEKTEEFIKKLEEISICVNPVRNANSELAQFLPKCFQCFSKIDNIRNKYLKDKTLTEDDVKSLHSSAVSAMNEINLIEKLKKLSKETAKKIFDGKI